MKKIIRLTESELKEIINDKLAQAYGGNPRSYPSGEQWTMGEEEKESNLLSFEEEPIFKRINKNIYKLFIGDDEVGSVYLDDTKNSSIFDEPLLSQFKNKNIWGIHQMGIKQKYHGKGYGNILLSNIIKKSKEKGIDLLVLGVMSNNYKAINLYTKYGFRTYKNGVAKYMFLKI